MEAKNLTTPEVAAKLLGKNFISLDEALKIFPNKKANLTNYDLIPYSPEVLYHCSEPENPFILVPAFPRCGKNVTLNIQGMHHLFYPPHDFFTAWTEIYVHRPQFIYKTVCEPRWYLISKRVMEPKELHQFCGRHEWSDRDFEIDRAVVYVYAWILFKLARNENIFLGGSFRTLDDFSLAIATLARLDCQMGKIHIGQWKPDDPRQPIEPGVVASVETYTPNSVINGIGK